MPRNFSHQQPTTQEHTMKLVPTFVTANVDAAATAILAAGRARPCACFTQDGQAVVCSARTARKNGWTTVARTWK